MATSCKDLLCVQYKALDKWMTGLDLFLKRALSLFCGGWVRRGHDPKEPAVAVQMGAFDDLDQGSDDKNGET